MAHRGRSQGCSATRLDGSRIFVSVAENSYGLPSGTAELIGTRATIGAVTCSVGSVDSLISAPNIGTLKLGRLAPAGQTLGIATRGVKSLSATGANGAKISESKLNTPAQSREVDSLTVRVIG